MKKLVQNVKCLNEFVCNHHLTVQEIPLSAKTCYCTSDHFYNGKWLWVFVDFKHSGDFFKVHATGLFSLY